MKKMKILMGCVPAAFLATLPVAGMADNHEGSYSLSPFVGGYTFDSKQRMETSPTFGLRYGYNFSDRVGAEAMFGYVLAESKDPSYPETDAYSYGIDVLYHFNPTGKLVPFVAGGLGGTMLNRPAPGLSDPSDWLYNVGGGIKYFINDTVALRGDIRDVMIPTDSVGNWVYTVGVTFLLGEEPKQVAAKPVECPVCAAPAPLPVQAKDNTAPYVTLASPFNASLDVPTHRKIRVAFSEAIDPTTVNEKTFIVTDGKTPVQGKVIVPTTTTASFTQSANLAPGTLYTARMTTGVKDLAGNPLAADYVWNFKTEPVADPKTVSKTVVIDKFVMLEDTNFEFDKATLSPKGKAMLDQNIQIMKDNPKLKVRIAGYTSAAGTEEYNQDLSERRADAVMGYMLDHGNISAERVDAIGYGETRPATYEPIPGDVQSRAAKSNMRVLFEIIVK